jgi:hypothetical protein
MDTKTTRPRRGTSAPPPPPDTTHAASLSGHSISIGLELQRDIDDGAADARHAGIALIALPDGAEERAAILVDPAGLLGSSEN